MSKSKPSCAIFSFFAGIGFLDLGFENANYNIVYVNEINESFLSAYRYARSPKNPPIYGYSCESVNSLFEPEQRIYLSNLIREARKSYDYVGFIGGPPCPDFSIAGKNQGCEGVNGSLTKSYFSLIAEHRPDFFLFENVKGLYRTKQHRSFYDQQRERLEDIYSMFESVENSINYGVPQYRERLFLVGFIKTAFGGALEFDFKTEHQRDWEAEKTLTWPTTTPFCANSDVNPPHGITQEITVEHWFKKNDVYNHPNSNDVFRIKRMDKYLSIPEGDTKGKSFKRLHRWRYAPTAAFGHNEVYLHPYKPRRISVSEALAIQSLPKSFKVEPDMSLSNKFKMVGNGVPYLMAFGIANNIYNTISSHKGNRAK